MRSDQLHVSSGKNMKSKSIVFCSTVHQFPWWSRNVLFLGSCCPQTLQMCCNSRFVTFNWFRWNDCPQLRRKVYLNDTDCGFLFLIFPISDHGKKLPHTFKKILNFIAEQIWILNHEATRFKKSALLTTSLLIPIPI